ncbi:MAG: MFS transporter, partial [Lysobacteraceae bacterium]
METLDASVIATALPVIAADFNVTVVGVSLSVTAYLVAMAIFVPAAGWCADRFGARRVFAAAVGLFTLASLLCGLAPSLWTLVAARVLQGAAAAFMSPVGRIVVLRETPRARLIESMAMITWPGLIGPVIGPPLGGLIVTYVSWRWIFLLNVPIGLLGMWLILRYLPRDRAVLRRPFDFKGFVLTAVALAALIQGLTHLGERQDGRLAGLAMVVVGLVCGVVSVRHALRAAAPMLDLRAARVRTFRLVTLTAGFAAR